jgi:hypothetical protein
MTRASLRSIELKILVVMEAPIAGQLVAREVRATKSMWQKKDDAAGDKVGT